MREADCADIKNKDERNDCKDANLIIHKANAAIEHCVYSSHHDKNEMKSCIDSVVKQRDHDNKMHGEAMDEKAPKIDPKKLKALQDKWEAAKVATTKAKVAATTARKDADAARAELKKAEAEANAVGAASKDKGRTAALAKASSAVKLRSK
jgi:hypothetical protein